MKKQIDYDRVASILVEAAYFGDDATAKKWGISTRTIGRYRARLHTDDTLSESVHDKKAAFELEWADEAKLAILSAIRFLNRAGQEADPTDPDSIHSVAGGLKILAEVLFVKEILDVRLARFSQQNGTEGRPVITATVVDG